MSIKNVYRGQKLPIAELVRLQDNIGSLVSMNGFLSTTKDCSTASTFACPDPNVCVDGFVSVVFDLEIDTTKTLPIACRDIETQSNFSDERECLFSVGAVWKLESVDDYGHLWGIKLSFCHETSSQLIELDQRLTNGFTYLSLGNILRELGDKSNAENFYYRMLGMSGLSCLTLGHTYYNLGTLAAEQGRYEDALGNIRKAEQCIPSNLASVNNQDITDMFLYSHNKLPSRLRIFNTLGLLYQRKGNYTDAHKSFTQALVEEGHEVEKGAVNNNLGLLEFDYGNYQAALDHHTNAVNMTRLHVWMYEFKKNLDRVKAHMSRMKCLKEKR